MSEQTQGMSHDEALKKLNGLIKDIRFAMLTTVDEDGSLRSRPMATQEAEFDGDLWFLTRNDSPKTDEIRDAAEVNVAYANPDDQVYVSISGRARAFRDQGKIDELWRPYMKAWFPSGKDDPQIALIKVHAIKAEYWDAPNGAMVRLVGFVKAVATGQTYQPGENKKLDLEGESAA